MSRRARAARAGGLAVQVVAFSLGVLVMLTAALYTLGLFAAVLGLFR